MDWQFTPYVIPLLLTVVLGGGVAVSAWKRRESPGAVPLFWLSISAGAWAMFNALEISSLDMRHKIVFTNIEYIGIVFIPVLWVLFALDYSGFDAGKGCNSRNFALLSIVPVVTLFFVWTNQWHGLMRQAVTLDMSGPFSRIVKTYGPWFWIHTAYSYGLIAFGSLITGHTVAHPSKLYRSQALILMSGVAIPWIANIAYLVYRGNVFSGFDITPTGFAISALLLEIGIARAGLFSIMRFAREHVLDEIEDAVIVTSASNHVADMNAAAQNLLGISLNSAIGQDVSEIFHSMAASPGAELDDLTKCLRQLPGSPVSVKGEISFTIQGERRFYEITISPLNTGGNRPKGKLITAKDVSCQKKTMQTLEQLQAELRGRAIRGPLAKP